MKIAIMQPYFFPYIGYFQLIGAVDAFVVYDNIKYTKKGWINRNRFLQNGQDALFSLSLKKDSDSLDIRDRKLSETLQPRDIIEPIAQAYRRSPFRDSAVSLLEKAFAFESRNLFDFIFHSLQITCTHLRLRTPLIISSTIDADHNLKAEQRVIAICKALGADHYVNAIGGQELYSKTDFFAHGISLSFLRARPLEYTQFGQLFIPWLSIIDVIAFNPPEAISGHLGQYDLI